MYLTLLIFLIFGAFLNYSLQVGHQLGLCVKMSVALSKLLFQMNQCRMF